jgi:hypothetical protein
VPDLSPILELPAPTLAESPDGPAQIGALRDRIEAILTGADPAALSLDGLLTVAGLSRPVVTALPSIPVDGQEVLFLADAVNGILQPFRYRAASASGFKWEAIGPSPLHAFSTAGGTRAGGTGFGDLTGTGTGPSIVSPYSGEVEIAFGASITNNSPGARTEVGVQIGATAATSDSAAAGAEDANAPVSAWRQIKRTVTAGQTIKLVYNSTASVGTFSERELIVTPVRAG